MNQYLDQLEANYHRQLELLRELRTAIEWEKDQYQYLLTDAPDGLVNLQRKGFNTPTLVCERISRVRSYLNVRGISYDKVYNTSKHPLNNTL